MYIISVYII